MSKTASLLVVALGDSISTAFNAEAPADNPAYSWVTGHASDGRIKSHLQRLQETLPHCDVHALNVAFNGARAGDLSRQLAALNGAKPDYATLLIGANDLMAWLWVKEWKPLLYAFKLDIEHCIHSLIQANDRIMIILSGVPDQARVVEIALKHRPGSGQMAQLLQLQPGLLDQLRRSYEERWLRCNDELQLVASAHPSHVRFVATSPRFQFDAMHLSKLDSYHPSVAGQRMLAEVTWQQGWFP